MIDESIWKEKKQFSTYRLFGEQGEHKDIIGSEMEE
jgi:hypothetical protein